MSPRHDEPDDLPSLTALTSAVASFTQASPARMYNYYLGGGDHYEIDRTAAHQVMAAAGGDNITRVARANLQFAGRAAAWAVTKIASSLVLDIGVGLVDDLPIPNLYEAVHEANREATLVGFDYDPIVVTHGRARGYTEVLSGDVRDIDAMLDHPDLAKLGKRVNLGQPTVAVLAAVLHFVGDDEDPARVLIRLHERLPADSALVFSHACSTQIDADTVAGMERGYDKARSQITFRSEEQIDALLNDAGWTPGMPLVDVERWAPPGEVAEQRDKPDPVTSVRCIGTVAFSSKAAA
ncbi:SAM-dependent methyltransferase [Actinomadura rudentiformis]|uniref:SAM-dependent methyltransferase n=1 Tax=Actinomadura rudentiformis TaxID=359158 RepID=A0A6H9YUD8_9ACTN|nr:SAM-dependent methyltransferase [Actinomadura rudentiformis]KAB2344908.1 hypothetical protein F8566_30425 [Actinomadura rudentiformis]